MNPADLMTDLARLGIRIEAHGDRLRYSPRSAVTPDLARRMKAHKGELLAILRRDSTAPSKKCVQHITSQDWTDEPAINRPGWIRTTCRRCGRFIGYRPARMDTNTFGRQ